MNEDTALIEQIAQLSSEEAQEAVQLFYEFLPDTLWVNGQKLAQEDLKRQATLLLKTSSPDVKPLLKALASEEHTDLKGDVARGLLMESAQNVYLHDAVNQAVQRVSEPHMFITLSMGAVLIILALIPTSVKIEKEQGHFKAEINFDNLKSLSTIDAKLKQIFDALITLGQSSGSDTSSDKNDAT